MTTAVVDLLAAARQAGIEFRVVGERIEYRPNPAPASARPLLEQLRQYRAEVLRALAPPDPFAARVAECERLFGEGAGYLALLGCLVRTPRGTGRCVQAFRDRCAVNLGERDFRGRAIVSFFQPRDLEVLQ